MKHQLRELLSFGVRLIDDFMVEDYFLAYGRRFHEAGLFAPGRLQRPDRCFAEGEAAVETSTSFV
jgi:hypothetical protein